MDKTVFIMKSKIYIVIILVSLSLNCYMLYKYITLKNCYIAYTDYRGYSNNDLLAVRAWNNTLEKLNCQRDIVFFGNSITYMSDFRFYFKHESIANLGYEGDCIERMKRRIPAIISMNPKKVFIMAGINDIHDHDPEEISVMAFSLIDEIKRALPNSEIYYQSILPISSSLSDVYATNDKILKTNELIKLKLKSLDVVYIDLFSLYCEDGEMPYYLTKDGIHLLHDSYERWADAISKYIY